MSEFNHNGQQENLMQIFMSYHRELFGLVKNYDSPFFFCLYCYLFVALLCLYFLCKLELFWAWPSYTRIPTNQISYFPIPILKHMRHLHYVRVVCRKGECWLLNVIHLLSASCLCKESPVRAELRFEFYRSRCLGSQSALVCFFLRNW